VEKANFYMSRQRLK